MTEKLFIEISDYNKYVICSICGSNKTRIKVRKGKGSPVWYNYKDDKICNNCYGRINGLKYRNNQKFKWYRLDYMGINLFLSFELPRNKCDICGITNKEKRIDRHHYFYCRIMPWAMTMAICKKCHQNITFKGRIIVKSITRTCLLCNKMDDYKEIPHKYENGYICRSCYGRLYKSKKKLYNNKILN